MLRIAIYCHDTTLSGELKRAVSLSGFPEPRFVTSVREAQGVYTDDKADVMLLTVPSLKREDASIPALKKLVTGYRGKVRSVMIVPQASIADRMELEDKLGIKKSVTHSGTVELLARKLKNLLNSPEETAPARLAQAKSKPTEAPPASDSQGIRKMRKRPPRAAKAKPKRVAPAEVQVTSRVVPRKKRRNSLPIPDRMTTNTSERPRRSASSKRVSKPSRRPARPGLRRPAKRPVAEPPAAELMGRTTEPPRSHDDEGNLLPGRARQVMPQPSGEQPVTAAQFFAKGQIFAEAGRLAHAHQAFAVACKKEPDNPEYMATKAWAMYLTDEGTAHTVEEQMKELAESSDLGTLIWGNLVLGRLADHQGNAGGAKRRYLEVLSLDAAHPEARAYIDGKDGHGEGKGIFGRFFKRN